MYFPIKIDYGIDSNLSNTPFYTFYPDVAAITTPSVSLARCGLVM